MNSNTIHNRFHVMQHDLSDCGVACLLTVLKSFGGHVPMSQLREWSGTSLSGSTLLGLKEAADKCGLDAEGFEAEIENLKTLTDPALLHVINEHGMNHFVVCFGYDEKNDTFEISDPATSHTQSWSRLEIENKWKSKALLLLKKSNRIKSVVQNDQKIHHLKWLYQFAKIDMDILFISFALGVFIAILGLSVAIFSQKLIDNILPDHNLNKLYIGSGLLLLLLMIRSGFNYIRQLFLLRQTKDFNIRLLSFFYGSLIHLPKAFFDSRKTGELISRMNDTTRIQQTVANVFTNLTLEVVTIIFSLGGLFYYHYSLGWIACLWLPAFSWIVYRYQRNIIDSQRQVMVAAAINESNYIDSMQGNGAIKIANKQHLIIDQSKSIYSHFQDRLYQLGIIGNNFNFLVQCISAVIIVGLIFYSSWLVIHTTLSTGVVLAVIQLISMAMLSATHIAIININLQETKVALERMQEFSSLPPEYDEAIDIEKIKIDRFESMQVSHVDFRYIGRPLIFSDLSLEIRRGEIIVIQGESGGGKSTLMQIIQRYYEPTEGEIIVNGKSLSMYSIPAWRNILGVVPQQVKIFNKSLVENISWNPMDETSLNNLITFSKKYGFDEFFERFPYGYHTMLGEDGVNLSGGQIQLVGLARALYHRPQLLLLDESTAAMDPAIEQKIFNLLIQFKTEMGIVFISHRDKTSSIADRVYRIQDGRCSLVIPLI